MGSVVISVDAELGWGFHDIDSTPPRRVEGSRAGWDVLASLLETYEVPATWAVVGHLALESCDGVHADHPLSPDWFARERGDWAHRPALRFAPDLVADLVGSPVDHDIGCHAFSHVVHTDVTRSVVRAEIGASLAALARLGVTPTSYVFPRNAVAHEDLLAEFGFTSYRSRGDPISPTRRRFRKLLREGGRSPRLARPEVDEHGLVAIPPSLFLFGFEGLARSVVAPVVGDPILEAALRGIDRAVDHPGILHLWLHPNDLAAPHAADRVERVLGHLRDRLDDTTLAVETMADVAARTLRREDTGPPSRRRT